MKISLNQLIRELIEKALTIEEIKDICSDFEFSDLTEKDQRACIRQLAERCIIKRKVPELLAKIKRYNSVVYKEHLSYWKTIFKECFDKQDENVSKFLQIEKPFDMEYYWENKTNYFSDIDEDRFPKKWDFVVEKSVWKIPPKKALKVLDNCKILIINGYYGTGKTVYLIWLANKLNDKLNEKDLWGREKLMFVNRNKFTKEEISNKEFSEAVLLIDLPKSCKDITTFEEALRVAMNANSLVVLTLQTNEWKILKNRTFFRNGEIKSISLRFSKEGLTTFCKRYLEEKKLPLNKNFIERIIKRAFKEEYPVLLAIRKNIDRFAEKEFALNDLTKEVFPINDLTKEVFPINNFGEEVFPINDFGEEAFFLNNWIDPIEGAVKSAIIKLQDRDEIDQFIGWLNNIYMYLNYLERKSGVDCITVKLAEHLANLDDKIGEKSAKFWIDEMIQYYGFFEVQDSSLLFQSEFGLKIYDEFLNQANLRMRREERWEIEYLHERLKFSLNVQDFLGKTPLCLFDILVLQLTQSYSIDQVFPILNRLLKNFPKESHIMRRHLPSLFHFGAPEIIEKLTTKFLNDWKVTKNQYQQEEILRYSRSVVDKKHFGSVEGFITACLDMWRSEKDQLRKSKLLLHSASVVDISNKDCIKVYGKFVEREEDQSHKDELSIMYGMLFARHYTNETYRWRYAEEDERKEIASMIDEIAGDF
ncbi:MAG: hypothetical protein ACFFC7_20335 [Candidatus Hermodarchaeota archaeon]